MSITITDLISVDILKLYYNIFLLNLFDIHMSLGDKDYSPNLI